MRIGIPVRQNGRIAVLDAGFAGARRARATDGPNHPFLSCISVSTELINRGGFKIRQAATFSIFLSLSLEDFLASSRS